MSKDEARCFTIVVVEKRAIPSTNETRKSPPLPCSAIENESINLSAGSSRDYRLLEIHFSIESFQLFLASLVARDGTNRAAAGGTIRRNRGT